VEGSWDAAAACSALGNAEGGVYRHQRDIRRIRPAKVRVNVSHSLIGHHVNANQALRALAVNARSRVVYTARSAPCAEALTVTSTAPRSST
jgi:hypothetical protein